MVVAQVSSLDCNLRCEFARRGENERAHVLRGICFRRTGSVCTGPSVTQARVDMRLLNMGLDGLQAGLNCRDKERHGLARARLRLDEQVARTGGVGGVAMRLREVGEEGEDAGLDRGHVGVLERVLGDRPERVRVQSVCESGERGRGVFFVASWRGVVDSRGDASCCSSL